MIHVNTMLQFKILYHKIKISNPSQSNKNKQINNLVSKIQLNKSKKSKRKMLLSSKKMISLRLEVKVLNNKRVIH